MRYFINLIERAVDDSERISAFNSLANAQRGEPELAMLHAQQVMGGGVLNGVIEHVGDLTHRMAHFPDLIDHSGYEMVAPKVKRCIQELSSGYGFARDVEENLKSNAEFQGKDYRKLQFETEEALRAYAAAHAQLRVYNEAQDLARDAAVALGNMQFDVALAKLRQLDKHLDTPEQWHAFAGRFDSNYQ